MSLRQIKERYAGWDDPMSESLKEWIGNGGSDLEELRAILVNDLDGAPLKEPMLVHEWVWEKWVLQDYCLVVRRMKSAPRPIGKKVHEFALEMIQWAGERKGGAQPVLTRDWQRSVSFELRYLQMAWLAQEAMRKRKAKNVEKALSANKTRISGGVGHEPATERGRELAERLRASWASRSSKLEDLREQSDALREERRRHEDALFQSEGQLHGAKQRCAEAVSNRDQADENERVMEEERKDEVTDTRDAEVMAGREMKALSEVQAEAEKDFTEYERESNAQIENTQRIIETLKTSGLEAKRRLQRFEQSKCKLQ